jgi:hypothetical protein
MTVALELTLNESMMMEAVADGATADASVIRAATGTSDIYRARTTLTKKLYDSMDETSG